MVDAPIPGDHSPACARLRPVRRGNRSLRFALAAAIGAVALLVLASTAMAADGVGTYGRTDEYGYNITDADGNPIEPTKDLLTPGAVHVHYLQATILQLLGVDHTRLTYKYQGRYYRLTDVHGHVVPDVLA